MSPGPLHAPTATVTDTPGPETTAPAPATTLAERLRSLQQEAGNAATARALTASPRQGAPFGHRRLLASPGWHQRAELYEQRLGAALAAAPEVRRAARTAVLRLYEVLSRGFTPEAAAGAFVHDDPHSAGQVGTEGDPGTRLLQWTAPDSNATVRELVTAFYNAAYYKYGPQPGPHPDERAVSLKTLLHRIVLGGDLHLARELGLDAEALSAQHAYLTGHSRAVLGRLPHDVRRLFAEDVFALGNLTLQQGAGTALSMGRSQRGRSERPDPDTAPGKRTLRDYRDLGVPLSEAEAAHARRSTAPLSVEGLTDDLAPARHEVTAEAVWEAMTEPGQEGPEFPLPWAPGEAAFAMSTKDDWYRKHHGRGAPLVAGISGTTTRMLSAFRWLQVVPGSGAAQLAEREFFLAVTAWMLTGRDHSLYEILRGAKAAGLRGLAHLTASSKDVPRMYRDFDAFARDVLPASALPELPYAALYEEKARAAPGDGGLVTVDDRTVATARRARRALLRQQPSADLTEWLAGQDLSGTDADAERARLGAELRLPYLLALAEYTGGNHQLVNRVLATPSPVATTGVHRLVDEMISLFTEGQTVEVPYATWRDAELQRLIDAYRAPGLDDAERRERLEPVRRRMHALAETLRSEAKSHADMLTEALGKLPPVRGLVYRAGWELLPRKRMTFSGFTSTSREREEAEKFLPLQHPPAGGRRVLYCLELTGHSGRDIAFFSRQQDEKEVLLLPQAAFTVNMRNRGEGTVVGGQHVRYDFVWATEVAGAAG
ncbi:hypothetical protein [Streptomyces morookaense]|uniref:NAD(+)--protein-arginine ADP-ribosyltransferase n=1 Tax=Streptomyces morookaense TaxID=1970 RepID=A0A7Y7AZT8_STRMO|nr:hypothetical protein [Streptomyces morookaense]NVK76408.1 hypothetical protein [Streptomyces morookaense]GHF06819.1 hypothetical protein GCM10010359_04890 [Streptomyces morookaense]